jgi:hypothetical protein
MTSLKSVFQQPLWKRNQIGSFPVYLRELDDVAAQCGTVNCNRAQALVAGPEAQNLAVL